MFDGWPGSMVAICMEVFHAHVSMKFYPRFSLINIVRCVNVGMCLVEMPIELGKSRHEDGCDHKNHLVAVLLTSSSIV